MLLRVGLRKQEVGIHGIFVPLALVPLRAGRQGTGSRNCMRMLKPQPDRAAFPTRLDGHRTGREPVHHFRRDRPDKPGAVGVRGGDARTGRRGVRGMLARNCPQVPHEVIACAIAPADGVIRSDSPRAGMTRFTGRAGEFRADAGVVPGSCHGGCPPFWPRRRWTARSSIWFVILKAWKRRCFWTTPGRWPVAKA